MTGRRFGVAQVSVGLSLAVIATLAVSLTVGYTPLPVEELLHGLLVDPDGPAGVILREIRLPRALLALIIGAALGLSGAALQGLLHNPLAEPGLTGVSATAGLGAVIALYFGFAELSPLALPSAAMAGAATATLVLFVLAARDASTLTLILAGIAVSSWAIALTSLAMNLSPNPFALSELVFWLLGSVRDRSMSDVWLCLPFVSVGGLLLLLARRGLDALSLGPDTAASLGFALGRLRAQVILGTALAVGASVAVSGAIGFVGLVVPHLMRPLVGHEPSRLLVPSALAGAVLVAAADVAVRIISVGPELQLGVVTSLLGAPFFLYLILDLDRSAP